MESPQILIIEDDADIARDLCGHAKRMGYSVCGIADNAAEAIAIAKRLSPNIVLMDSRMEHAEIPLSLSEPLESPFLMPVVLLIGAGDDVNIQHVARHATHGYLIIPSQPRELRAAIQVALYKANLEQRLRSSERWFTDTLRCVTDGIIAVDTDGHISFINLAAERILGVEMELAQNRKIEEVLCFEDSHIQSATEVLRTGSTFGIDFGKWITNTQGERLPVDHSAAPIRDENDLLIGAVVVVREASARIATEEALRFSEDRFRTAFENAEGGMALVTMDGHFVEANPAFYKLLKFADVDLHTLKITDITPPENHLKNNRRLTRLIIGAASSLEYEQKICPRIGPPLSARIIVSLLLRDEIPLCYFYQFHDLTTKKRAESLERGRKNMSKIHAGTLHAKQIAESSNEYKTAFIASMSHELRTPLNAILGFSQLLENDDHSALTSDQHDSIRNIQRAGWHLLDLINDILDLGKIESGKLRLAIEDVYLKDLLPSCIQFISTKAAESHIFVDATGDFSFMVKADRIRLRQVILNFLSNAVKYNRDGGCITIACTQRGAQVRIAVSDTGIGLEDEQKAHLFEPFNRLGKEGGIIEGSGIGLVITKNLVESMGGRIGVDSHPETGSAFWVELPGNACSTNASQDELAATLTRPLPHSPTPAELAHPRKILYIEDNPVNMLLVSKIVQQRPDWTLIAATTGESGFDLATTLAPDLILLDISLPDISGLELIKRLRKNAATRAIPVAAVSANAGPQYIQEALACGFDRYITKPIRLTEFVQTIEGLLLEVPAEAVQS